MALITITITFSCSVCLTPLCLFSQAKQNLGPGEYDLKSFLHELQGGLLVMPTSRAAKAELGKRKMSATHVSAVRYLQVFFAVDTWVVNRGLLLLEALRHENNC